MHNRLLILDLLRIFAALSVMSFHLGYWMWLPDLGDAADLLSAAGAPTHEPVVGFWWGWIGVQIFFTLSGYLIAGVETDWRRFLMARARRLLPGALVCSLVTTALVASILGFDGASVRRLAASIILWPFGPWVDDVYWTLGMEMGFYTLVALLLAGGKGVMLERVMIALSAVSVLGWVASMSNGHYAPQLPGLDDRVSQLILLKDAPLFAAGVILRNAASGGWTTSRVAAFATVAIGGCTIILAEGVVRGLAAELSVDPVLPAIGWVVALVLIATLNHWSSSNLVSTLSRATFPLYLLHNVGGAAILIHAQRQGLDRAGATLVAVLVTLFLALAVTVHLEPAILRVVKRKPAALPGLGNP